MTHKKTSTNPKKPVNTVKPMPIVEPTKPDQGLGT